MFSSILADVSLRRLSKHAVAFEMSGGLRSFWRLSKHAVAFEMSGGLRSFWRLSPGTNP